MAVHVRLVRCKCGKAFRVPEERAGRRLKCFVCQREVITADEPAASATPPAPAESIVAAAPGTDGAPAFPTGLIRVGEGPATDTGATAAQLAEASRYAAEQLAAGVPADVIERGLVSQGYDSASARTLLTRLRVAQHNAGRAAAQHDLLVGTAWFVGGVVVSVVSYSLATSHGGTRYILAGGAIVYGFYRFFKGLFRLD
jgi:hypothetical protein